MTSFSFTFYTPGDALGADALTFKRTVIVVDFNHQIVDNPAAFNVSSSEFASRFVAAVYDTTNGFRALPATASSLRFVRGGDADVSVVSCFVVSCLSVV
jgi:hypothetical protein